MCRAPAGAAGAATGRDHGPFREKGAPWAAIAGHGIAASALLLLVITATVVVA